MNSEQKIAVTQQFPGSGDNKDWENFTANGGNTRDNCTIIGLSRNEVKIKVGDGNGNASNRNFCFVAV
ncbi:hypothetical protein [Spartinivicinus poritis]|uniref:Uncharacterized protein n=1 Tax=Spartinivicinus poritis TaxID=2994640 RepID=A0ABT5U7Y6_9GAMM|nr:hypothetical protein [Spartinivicinus sp. A2-2]MDE1462437.1 hypothetical protein [Spartinivicinus sp. A2-2]